MSAGNISQFLQGYPQPTTSAVTSLGNTMSIFSNSKVTPASVLDYAVTANAGSTIVAATSLTGNVFGAQANYLAQCVTDKNSIDGNIYELSYVVSAGLVLTRFSPGGVLLTSVTIEAATTWLIGIVRVLSNGNVAVSYAVNSATGTKYAVYDKALQTVIKAPGAPTGGTVAYGYGSFMVTLTGGGFAIIYGTSATAANLTMFDNTGTQTATAAITSTFSSSNLMNMVQLSSGNLAFAWNPGSGNYTYAIYSTAGGQVKAPTSTAIAVNSSYVGAMAATTGYFAMGLQVTSTTYSVQVYDNTGTKQGSNIPITMGALGSGLINTSLLADPLSARFWIAYAYNNSGNTNPYQWQYATISTAAVLGAINNGSSVTPGSSGFGVSVFDPVGNIISVLGNSANGAATVASIWDSTTQQIVSSANIDSSASAGSFSAPLVLSDGAVLYFGGNASGLAYFKSVKYLNSAIIGVALNSVSANAACPVDTTPGYKVGTPLLGSPTKTFDMSSTNIVGNKGSITVGGGVSLKGIGN